MSNEKKQTKSKERVRDHGEVFTNEREVKAMCDLVGDECNRIDSRFLEPACGDGNFLAEILTRKLAVVKRKYGKSPLDYEKNAVLAATSIYGVDILLDNVLACRDRMFELWDKEYVSVCGSEANDDTREAVKFIFKRNIVCGNALTLKCVDENAQDTSQPIVFSEWAFVTGGLLKRRDFRFDELLSADRQEHSLFSLDWEFDVETQTYMPRPIKEFAPIHYRRIRQDG